MPATIFKRIIDREVPSDIVYEDDRCLAFRDVSPQAPTHVLLIPKKEIASIAQLATEDQMLVGHLLLVVRKLAEELGLASGYRVVVTDSLADAIEELQQLEWGNAIDLAAALIREAQ